MPPAKPKPLTFESTPDTDTPEVAAYKARLLAAAEESVNEAYGNSPNWRNHSPVLEKLLRKLDLQPERKVKVKVTTTHPFEFVVDVLPSTLAGKTVTEQREVLAAKIGPLTLTSSSLGSATVTVPGDAIVSMEVLPEPEVKGAEDGTLWYRHDFARVQHAYNVQDLETERWTEPACGNGEMGLGGIPSAEKLAFKAQGPSVGRCKKCVAVQR